MLPTHGGRGWSPTPSSCSSGRATTISTIEDLSYLDATALAELVRLKQIKPIELVEGAIDRIERLNPTINAVVTSMYEEAREAATNNLPEGPFTGVPFLLKDLVATYAGVRTTSGSLFLRNFIADRDSTLVTRQKQGFGFPLGIWMRTELRSFLQKLFAESRFVERGIFNSKYVNRILSEHLSGRVDHNYRLWILLNLEFWHRLYFEGESIQSMRDYTERLMRT